MNIYLRVGVATGLILVIFVGWFTATNNNKQDLAEHGTDVAEHADDLATYEISPSQAVQRMKSDEEVILIDVRATEEYQTIHLQDALLLPVQELSLKTLQMIGAGSDKKDSEIILYGRSGSRSKTAYDLMTSLGYTNVKSVAGGMVHWKEDTYPMTETGVYTGPSFGNTENATKEVAGPKIMFDRTFEKLGVITQYGGVEERDFTVTNDGTQTLEIGDITTSCSCTSATISDSNIEPGNSAVLTVIFDPDFHAEPEGVFTRTVFIPSNDPNTPEAEVTIEVDIAEGE